jgi:hypothetical protein
MKISQDTIDLLVSFGDDQAILCQKRKDNFKSFDLKKFGEVVYTAYSYDYDGINMSYISANFILKPFTKEDIKVKL